MGQTNETMYAEEAEAAANMRTQESTVDFSDFPDEGLDVKVSDNGGEVAMSMEETNR
jgi:hypothetical protein